ncbi:MAG: hypothetical protein VW378_07685 [bacterium]
MFIVGASHILANPMIQSCVANFAKGNATTAEQSGLEAVYRNPAGLVGLQKNTLSIMSGSYFNKLYSIQELAFAYRLKNKLIFAITLPTRRITNIRYQENETLHNEIFEDKKQQVQFSLAKQLVQNKLSVGLTMAYQTQKLYKSKANGYFISLGALWAKGPFQIGTAIQRLGGLTINWDYGKKEHISPQLLTGLTWTPKKNLLLLTDIEYQNNTHAFNIGASYHANPLINLHIGLNHIQQIDQQLNTGLSITLNPINIHYAYTNHELLGRIHKIKFIYDFH